jgi:glyoxylase-like metal-dependent hydrolase (beta-lactamase superfamily II)
VLGHDYRFHYSNGHTPGLLLTEVASKDGPIVFASDLIPGTPWMRLAVTMGYDRFPEKIIEEKQQLLKDLSKRKGRLFFTHDSKTALAHCEFDDVQKQFVPTNQKDSLAKFAI